MTLTYFSVVSYGIPLPTLRSSILLKTNTQNKMYRSHLFQWVESKKEIVLYETYKSRKIRSSFETEDSIKPKGRRGTSEETPIDFGSPWSDRYRSSQPESYQ